jgi:adenylate kinase family enzyme
MRRVLVVGCGGAGKSTFARRLGEKTGLPVVHLDAEFWRPGWVEPPDDEWRETVKALMARDAWILDGNYGATLDLRLKACDTAIFLDRSRWVCLFRVLSRVARFRGRARPDMAPGCAERVDGAFLRWIWRYPRDSRPTVLGKLAAATPDVDVVTLRSEREVERFLAAVRAEERPC